MASILAPVATNVGLQVLLQPYSHTIGNIACTAVGVIYPAYASFKAVEVMRLNHDNTEAQRWLTYWSVLGALSAIERVFDKLLPWVPYYSTLKLGFLLWLQLPRYGGAFRLSAQFVRPLLRSSYQHIDALLIFIQESLQRPELAALGHALHEVFARVPVLEWFVRGPDGRPLHSSFPNGSGSSRGGRTSADDRGTNNGGSFLPWR